MSPPSQEHAPHLGEDGGLVGGLVLLLLVGRSLLHLLPVGLLLPISSLGLGRRYRCEEGAQPPALPPVFLWGGRKRAAAQQKPSARCWPCHCLCSGCSSAASLSLSAPSSAATLAGLFPSRHEPELQQALTNHPPCLRNFIMQARQEREKGKEAKSPAAGHAAQRPTATSR